MKNKENSAFSQNIQNYQHIIEQIRNKNNDDSVLEKALEIIQKNSKLQLHLKHGKEFLTQENYNLLKKLNDQLISLLEIKTKNIKRQLQEHHKKKSLIKKFTQHP